MIKTIFEPEWNPVFKQWVVVVMTIEGKKKIKIPHFFISEKADNRFILDTVEAEKLKRRGIE